MVSPGFLKENGGVVSLTPTISLPRALTSSSRSAAAGVRSAAEITKTDQANRTRRMIYSSQFRLLPKHAIAPPTQQALIEAKVVGFGPNANIASLAVSPGSMHKCF